MYTCFSIKGALRWCSLQLRPPHLLARPQPPFSRLQIQSLSVREDTWAGLFQLLSQAGPWSRLYNKKISSLLFLLILYLVFRCTYLVVNQDAVGWFASFVCEVFNFSCSRWPLGFHTFLQFCRYRLWKLGLSVWVLCQICVT